MAGSIVAGIALTAGLLYARPTCERAVHRLVLHTYAEPDAVYLSAWDQGDVRVTFKSARLEPITFTTRASISDGCRWLGIETLEPLDERTFAYRYDEQILECDPDANPARKTPRTGIVVVED